MRIAVTGAAGRVGHAVVQRALADGHQVVSIDRTAPAASDAEPVILDLADFAALRTALDGCEALIHCAAIPGPGLLPDHVIHDNNVVASYHALTAAAEVGIRRIVQASSVNAIGGRFSRMPRYDYFPVDEQHPSYAEDAYSLSKWICEKQAFAISRRVDDMSIASLRLHAFVDDPVGLERWIGSPERIVERHLWGWTRREAAARAFLLGITADFDGHEVFDIVAPETMMEVPSVELAAEHYPEVPLRRDLPGRTGFFDCGKAETMLGWHHDET